MSDELETIALNTWESGIWSVCALFSVLFLITYGFGRWGWTVALTSWYTPCLWTVHSSAQTELPLVLQWTLYLVLVFASLALVCVARCCCCPCAPGFGLAGYLLACGTGLSVALAFELQNAWSPDVVDLPDTGEFVAVAGFASVLGCLYVLAVNRRWFRQGDKSPTQTRE